jgi:hypothetical protein
MKTVFEKYDSRITNRYALFNMQFKLLRLQGAEKWQFKAEREKLSLMSEHDMLEYVTTSWWNHWKKSENNSVHLQ